MRILSSGRDRVEDPGFTDRFTGRLYLQIGIFSGNSRPLALYRNCVGQVRIYRSISLQALRAFSLAAVQELCLLLVLTHIFL